MELTDPVRAATPAALLLAGTLLGAGCTPAPPPVKSAGAGPRIEHVTEEPADPVRLEVTTSTPEVKIGGDIVFNVRLTNGGKEPVRVNVPRLGRNSVHFRVRRGTRITMLERLNADLDLSTGSFVWKPNRVEELAAGESMDTELRTPAIEVGEFGYAPQYARLGATELNTAPAVVVKVNPDGENTHLGAQLDTNFGPLVVRLRPDLAFNTVASFASLVKEGFYDGLLFHRVVKGFMAQGGDPWGEDPSRAGQGGPGYFLPLEAHTKLLHERGVLSMARTGNPHTAGSQFFLMFTRYPSLDPAGPSRPGYTVFGTLVEEAASEMTLTRIEAVGATPRRRGDSEAPSERVEIRKATLVTLP